MANSASGDGRRGRKEARSPHPFEPRRGAGPDRRCWSVPSTALKELEVYRRREEGGTLKGRLSSGSPTERSGLVGCINQAQLCAANPAARDCDCATNLSDVDFTQPGD